MTRIFDDDDEHSLREQQDHDDDGWGCCFPGECCMPSDHMRSECHTAEMMEERAREFDAGLDAIHTIKQIRDISNDETLGALQRHIKTDIALSQFFVRHPECDEKPAS